MKKNKLKKISLTGRYTTKILTYNIDLTAKAIQTSIETVKKGDKDTVPCS